MPPPAPAPAQQRRRLRRWLRTLRILGWIAAWYVLSGGLSFYNKWLVGKNPGQLNFGFPMSITTVHFAVQWGLATLLVPIVLRRKPPASAPASSSDPTPPPPELPSPPPPPPPQEAEPRPDSPTRATEDTSPPPSQERTWQQYLTYVVPPSLATALDISLSNYSLVFNTLTFYVLCKSTTPIFILLFMFLLRIEKPSATLFFIIIIMCTGLGLAVYGETQFDWRGFVLVMVASVLGGVRWALVQVLLQHKTLGLHHPLLVLRSLTPIMFCTMLVVVLPVEQSWKIFLPPHIDSVGDVFFALAVMAGGGCVAFFMILVEYHLVQDTSAIVIGVAGAFKEVLTIVVSHFVFHDDLDAINAAGLVVVIFGIGLFHLFKARRHPRKVPEGTGSTDDTSLQMDEVNASFSAVPSMTLTEEEGNLISTDQHRHSSGLDSDMDDLDMDDDDEEIFLLDEDDDGHESDSRTHHRPASRRGWLASMPSLFSWRPSRARPLHKLALFQPRLTPKDNILELSPFSLHTDEDENENYEKGKQA